jgi:hypothetical protein
VGDRPVRGAGEVAVGHHHQVGAGEVADQVDEVVDGRLGGAVEGDRAGGVAAGVEPEGHGEAELEVAVGRPLQGRPVGADHVGGHGQVVGQAGRRIVEPALEGVGLDVELDPLEALAALDLEVVGGHQLDQLLAQVAQLAGPAGPAPQGLHGDAGVAGHGHEPPDLAADPVQQGLVAGGLRGQLGRVQVVAELQEDGAEAVGPQEPQPPGDLGVGQLAGPVPLVDGHPPGHIGPPEPAGAGAGTGAGGQAGSGDDEHGGQREHGGCSPHALLRSAMAAQPEQYRQAGPGS